ncbi:MULTISPECIES: hypothetical protein [Romboutsia]|jgi:hypothetical protein|uniref:Uncharacterized protein n=2 Tax=Romboutsia ilealis TaxID=1115758 RepID=A0A1V1I1G7_9FIRM|nr:MULTISPECIES: hypothetical protein [Romboutsia]MCI9260827.1 hypothetical protein [Romboutsia sp.]CED94058.1 Hypothetical protein CRIB_1450 [Romboutsia ilealis]
MDLNFKSRRNKNKNKLMKKINFFQDKINYDDIMSYGDNSYEDNYDEIILNDDIFIDSDDKFNEDIYKDDTLFY